MSQVSGIIKRKLVKGTEYGNRYSFMVGTDWYGVTDTKIKDSHIRELVEGLKEGDEVEFEFTDTPKKDKPGESWHNIVGAIRVDRLDKGVPANVQKQNTGVRQAEHPQGGVQPSGRSEAQGGRGESDTRIRSMSLAYSKDLVVAGRIERMEWKNWAKEFEQYIQTGE